MQNMLQVVTYLQVRETINANNTWETLQEVENSSWNSHHITFTLYSKGINVLYSYRHVSLVCFNILIFREFMVKQDSLYLYTASQI
jgi:hypothetical protein